MTGVNILTLPLDEADKELQRRLEYDRRTKKLKPLKDSWDRVIRTYTKMGDSDMVGVLELDWTRVERAIL